MAPNRLGQTQPETRKEGGKARKCGMPYALRILLASEALNGMAVVSARNVRRVRTLSNCPCFLRRAHHS